MNVAFLTYQYTPNKPEGMPDAWPAELVYLGESTTPPGTNWQVMSYEDYLAYRSTNQEDYNAWLAILEQQMLRDEAKNKVLEDMNFGRELIAEFGAQSAVNALTSEQIINISQRLAGVQALLMTGSLNTVLDVLPTIVTDELLPQEVLDYFAQKIRDYLGIK